MSLQSMCITLFAKLLFANLLNACLYPPFLLYTLQILEYPQYVKKNEGGMRYDESYTAPRKIAGRKIDDNLLKKKKSSERRDDVVGPDHWV